MSLHSGERQVSPTLAGIRADHLARYKFAASHWLYEDICVTNLDSPSRETVKGIGSVGRIVDIGCGTGYGCKILADSGYRVIGIDNDAESLDFASQHYAHENIEYLNRDLAGWPKLGRQFDAAVCFETIEHLRDPKPMLRKIGCRLLLTSVPNESVFKFTGQQFHFRHYTKAEFEALLNSCGWSVCKWYTQDDTKADVRDGDNGWTLIAACVRSDTRLAKAA